MYTGDEINSSYVYAQFFTTIWCVLTYSSGMPILYPVACLNFFLMYWVYKLLLVKFYRKTISFNQDLPQYSIKYLRFGIFLHVVMGAFILTNKALVSSAFVDQYFGDIVKNIEMEISARFKSEHFVLNILRERLCSGVGLIYVGVLSSLVVVYYAMKFVWSLVSNFCAKVCCRCLIKSKEQNEEAHNKYKEEL